MEVTLPAFKIKLVRTHRVDNIYSEELDMSSQTQWDEVKSKAKDMMDEDEFDQLPDSPPDDIAIWLSVYQWIDPLELKLHSQDWVSDRKGNFVDQWFITDFDDNIVLADSGNID